MTEQETPAYRIFHSNGDKFLCRITAAFCANSASLEQYGAPTTGNAREDLAMAGEDILTYRTIAQLAKLHALGSKVQLADPTESLLIYNLVRTYLGEQAKQSSLYYMANVSDDEEKKRMERVIDDITVIAELINALQDKVKITLDATPMRNALFGNLRNKVLPRDVVQVRTQDELPENIITEFTDNITTKALADSTKELTWLL